MTLLWVDIETRSRVDLKAFGVYRYVECPDWGILMASWAQDDGPVQHCFGEDIKNIPGLWSKRVKKVAHNAQFERVNFSRLHGLPTGQYLAPEEYLCTQALAAEWGYPQKLFNLSRSLGHQLKDEAGTALINLFCKPRRDGTFTQPEEEPEKWLQFISYCDQDVEAMRSAGMVLTRMGGWPTDDERLLWYADQRINDRGIAIDLRLAEQGRLVAEDNRMLQELEIMNLTGVRNPGSLPQMGKWAASVGLDMPNWQADTVEAVLETEIEPVHRQVLELRQELALVAAKKFDSAMGSACADGRYRGGFRFAGAHTLRWTAGGVQMHNHPRLSFTYEDDLTGKKYWDERGQDLAYCDLMIDGIATAADLKRLVRPMFVGPFTVLDYASIEARILAWLAGENWVLQAFIEGRDLYVENAARMGTSYDRGDGKVAELALGYNGGVNSLRKMGATGDDKHLQGMVYGWRENRPLTVKLWRTMQDAISQGGPVGEHLVLRRGGKSMRLQLPSGRAISYHGVSYDRYRVVIDKLTGETEIRESWRYREPGGGGLRVGTYGGKLCENVTQAIARDIMAAALVRMDKLGLPVVGHVHDEIILDGTHDIDELAAIMCELPSWAAGLPLEAVGTHTDRYRKT